MPRSYDYSEPKRLFSKARLTSYQAGIDPEDDAALMGAYSWNMALVGAFYPMLQIIEVSLRNCINEAAKDKYSTNAQKHWFEIIQYKLDETGNTPENVSTFKNNLQKAKRYAKKALESKGIQAEPTLDQIVASTDFSTWECILDKHFYSGAGGAFLWPGALPKAFKKMPMYEGSNPRFHQRDLIRRRIESVRSFRNRISHNEPAWRVAEAASKEKIVESLKEKLADCIELMLWISPRLERYVRDIGVVSRIEQLLTIDELNKHMHLMEPYDIAAMDDLYEILGIANGENVRCTVAANGQRGVIHPNNTMLGV
ncbi:hypothetical protein ACVBEJ_14345 [Porticoccus sp. GXU_MW_L64]